MADRVEIHPRANERGAVEIGIQDGALVPDLAAAAERTGAFPATLVVKD